MKKLYILFVLFAVSLTAAAQCSTTVMPYNANSSFGRAPSGQYMSIRTVYLIPAAEMTAAGFLTGQAFSEIGWSYLTAPSAAVGGNLNILLENTTDATYLKSTDWATATGPMTSCRNAATTLPATVGAFNIPLTTSFNYTGGGVYVAFEWTNCTTPLAAITVECNNSLVSGLRNVRSTTSCVHGTTMAASSFRPVTSFASTVPNDAKVDYIYNFGELAVGKSTNTGLGATIVNNSGMAMTNIPVTLHITGANTFTTTVNIATLAACGSQFVGFTSLYTPTNEGVDTVRVSIPADANNANNVATVLSNVNKQDIAYKNLGETSTGGGGFNTGTGTLAMRFTTAVPSVITHANLNFNTVTTPSQYRIAIYPDNAGVPSTTPLYVDANNRTNATGQFGVKLESPVNVPAGVFYLGLLQMTANTNIASGFTPEVPVRSGSFFFSSNPPATWTDFGSAGFNAKLLSGVRFCYPTTPNGIIASATTGCQGSSILFVADTTGIESIDSFTWILPAGYIGNSITDSIYVTPSSTADTIKCVANYPCGTSDTIRIGFTPTALSSTIARSNAGNTMSTPGLTTTMEYLSNGQIGYYSDINCHPMVIIADTPGGNQLGTTSVDVNVSGSVPNYNSQPYVPRTFTISPASNGPATVLLYVSQADFTAYNGGASGWPQLPTSGSNADPNIPNIRITKVDGALGTGNAEVITPTINWNSTDAYWELYFPVDSFSTFYIHGVNPGNVVLPVSWQTFNVERNGTKGAISWSTSSEQNNSHFNVQHSTNGQEFSNINAQKSKAIGGISNRLLDYKYDHLDPVTGNNYYRIEQVDINNNVSYSRVKNLIWDGNDISFKVYPQPANADINIEAVFTKESQVSLQLSDLSGRIINTKIIHHQKGKTTLRMNAANVLNGLYLLRLIDNGETIFVQKINIQH